MDQFDNRLIVRIARTTDFNGVVKSLESPSESVMVDRFVRVLRLLKKDDTCNQRSFVAAKAMLPRIPTETREFLLRVCEEQVFGSERLNVVAQLRLSCITPLVLLNDMFAKNHNSKNLKKAAKCFSVAANSMVLSILAENVDNPEVLLP